MAGEVREVAMPGSTVEPDHVMSSEGAARLAALTPADLDDGATLTETRSAKAVRDADGNEANLETGEYKPAEQPVEQPDPQSERTAPRPEVDVSEIPPLAVSDRYRADAEGYRQDAAMIAREHNIPAWEVGALYEFIGSAVAAELASAASDATSYGQTPGADLANPDACRQSLRVKYGPMADALMSAATKEFHALPKDVQAWLENDTGDGRRLSNSPAVIEGLALRPFARLSPEAAQKELNSIRNSKEYMNGDKLSVAKARMLSIVLSRPATQSAPQPGTRGIVYPVDGNWGRDAAPPTQGAEAAAKLRKELTALSRQLMDSKHELASNPKKRKAALARRQEISASLEGQA